MERDRREDNKTENDIIHVICWAGSDRSRLVAEELNRRGYIATHGGVITGHNYTTPDDLVGVGTIIFTDDVTREKFKKDKTLTRQTRASGAEILTLCLSEQEKEIAFQGGEEKLEAFKKVIAAKLDLFGFSYKKMKY